MEATLQTRSTLTPDLCNPDALPNESDRFRLLLFNSSGTKVLLNLENSAPSLPEITTMKYTRPAREITSALQTTLGLPTVLLFVNEDHQGKPGLAVLEAAKAGWQVPVGLEWAPIRRAASVLGANEGKLLQIIHAKIHQPHFPADPAPFSRLGWLRRLIPWIAEAIQAYGELGDWTQFNGSEAFSLLRFETTGKPVWFKAVGEPNVHEFSITQSLARLLPDFIPEVISSDPLLNAWLMKSGGEATLHQCEDVQTWRNAVDRLALLQTESVRHAADLLNAGARDLRTESLLQLVSPFIKAMERLMAQQATNSPRRLIPTKLAGLASTIEQALHSMSRDPIPNALGHSDFNPGNILVDGGRCVITDWAAAHIGNPFLTFEYFIEHLRKSPLAMHESCLRDAYIQRWLHILPAVNVDHALRLSPLIAVYAYAVSCDGWRDPEQRPAGGYMRSLTRRMKAEADRLQGVTRCRKY
jgi:thiamine kinase-like enzyme